MVLRPAEAVIPVAVPFIPPTKLCEDVRKEARSGASSTSSSSSEKLKSRDGKATAVDPGVLKVFDSVLWELEGREGVLHVSRNSFSRQLVLNPPTTAALLFALLFETLKRYELYS